ncbi:MAG: dipicolinate synthase subunit B [Acetanaerobacterium sp.]
MTLVDVHVGVGITGSFCTHKNVLTEVRRLTEAGAIVHPILSDRAQTTDTRFGTAEALFAQLIDMTGHDPVCTIEDAEPLGPKGILDILLIAPCTGNTAAKLANAIADTPVLMAAKGNLRGNKPLVLALSTNDALGFSLKNIGMLLNAKNIYFVPFGQDNPMGKPNSMIAHMPLIIPTLELALEGRQLQPVVQSPHSATA